MSRIEGVVAVLGEVCVLLVGCSEDDPRPRMAPTPTPSATPTPSQMLSVEPTPIESPEVLGPEGTVRAWIEARNQAMATGDTADVTALSGSGCSSCRDLIAPIEETYAQGGRYETSGWTVVRSKVEGNVDAIASVTVALRLAGGTTYDSAEAAPINYPAERRIAVFELAKDVDTTWLVSLIGFLR